MAQFEWRNQDQPNLAWLEEATINQIQEAMADGKLTAVELTLWYMERIAMYDQDGPKINSVLELNPDALHIAEALDVERKTKGARGPLHGMPILLKDNIDTGDKMHTSAGSLALANSYAAEDAFIVKQLRQAGAIILGKVNMSEWAGYVTSNKTNGYSSRGGYVLNPYGPGKYDVGGSSSGSGASVAANFTVGSIGTETSGSIIHPSSRNSIVGIKPTVGLLSRSGVLPLAHSQDTPGPMARTVTDAMLILCGMLGQDENDPISLTNTEITPEVLMNALDANGLKGARIGIPRESYKSLNEGQQGIINAAIEKIEAEGAIIVDNVPLNSANDAWTSRVIRYEFKADIDAYLSKLSPHVPVHSLDDLIKFHEENAETTCKYGQDLFLNSAKTSGTLTEREYIESRARDLYLSRTVGIDAVMAEYELDVLLFPANFGIAMPARAGYPSITVPGGYLPDGEPFGVTFTAKAYQEPTLVKLAYAYEQATKHRVPPKF